VVLSLRPHHSVHLTRGTLQGHVRTVLLQMRFHLFLGGETSHAVERAVWRLQRLVGCVALLQMLAMVFVNKARIALRTHEIKSVQILGQLFVVFGGFQSGNIFLALGADLFVEGLNAGST